MLDSEITIRECVSFEDFQQCIELERRVWGGQDIDIMPVRLYQISKACNAPTIGAFDEGGRLVGFGHSMLALVNGNLAYHSHMLAVVEELRDRDIGYRIKLAQRERALQLGISLIFWTFDPLQSRNAHFNINKLGAVIRRYEVNYYGQGVSTSFDSEVPTDRLIAEWWIRSPHVESVLAGARARLDEQASVAIPDDIKAIRARSVDEHMRWRLRVREEFQQALSKGLIARGFVRDPEAGLGRYLFGFDEEQFHFSAYGAR